MKTVVRGIIYLFIPIVLSLLAAPLYEVVAQEKNVFYFAFLAVFSWIAAIMSIVFGTTVLYLLEALAWLDKVIIRVKSDIEVVWLLPRAASELSTEFTSLLGDKKVSFAMFVAIMFVGTTVYLMIVGHLVFYVITSIF